MKFRGKARKRNLLIEPGGRKFPVWKEVRKKEQVPRDGEQARGGGKEKEVESVQQSGPRGGVGEGMI